MRDERLKKFCSSHNILGLLRKTELGESYRMQDKAMNTDILLKNLRTAGVKHLSVVKHGCGEIQKSLICDCVKFPSAGQLTHISVMLNITSDITYALPL